jgi:hypothetical protein
MKMFEHYLTGIVGNTAVASLSVPIDSKFLGLNRSGEGLAVVYLVGTGDTNKSWDFLIVNTYARGVDIPTGYVYVGKVTKVDVIGHTKQVEILVPPSYPLPSTTSEVHHFASLPVSTIRMPSLEVDLQTVDATYMVFIKSSLSERFQNDYSFSLSSSQIDLF